MAAEDYTWITYDLRTRARLAELPLVGAQYSAELNRAGVGSGSVPLDSQILAGVDVRAATERGRTGIYADRGGVPVWAGIIWDREYDSTTGLLKLDLGQTWSYYRRRHQATTYQPVGVDQLTIARNLMSVSGLSNGLGDMNLEFPAPTSGVLRDRNYYQHEKGVTLGELIENLADVINGFDFSIDLEYESDGDLRQTLHFYYPRRGRTVDLTEHLFEYGEDTRANIVSYTWPDPGSQEANLIWNMGAGDGTLMQWVGRFDSSRLTAGWPLLEDTISNKDTTTIAALTEQADEQLRIRADLRGIPTLTVLADADPVFGAWTLGDEIRLRINDYRWPRRADGTIALDEVYRITGYNVKVPSDGEAETVDLTVTAA